jgi:P pilus assembly chaperone PapD
MDDLAIYPTEEVFKICVTPMPPYSSQPTSVAYARKTGQLLTLLRNKKVDVVWTPEQAEGTVETRFQVVRTIASAKGVKLDDAIG